MSKELKINIDKSIKAYIKAFEKKQGVSFEFAIDNDLLGPICFGDFFFNLSDVVFDIDTDQPKGLIIDWQNAIIDHYVVNPIDPTINYKSWCMGARYGQ